MGGRDIEHYAELFAHLNTSKNRRYWTSATRYQAPYKPFLLLSVLDLFEQGEIRSNLIELSHEFGETFARYCETVWIFDGGSKIHLPFYHLRSEGFWHLLPGAGREDTLRASSGVQSLAQLQDLIVGVRLDTELYKLLKAKENRDGLRRVLIETYFSSEVRESLIRQGIVNRGAFLYSEELLKRPDAGTVGEVLTEEEAYRPAVRDQGFRRAVVTAYAHRCALCGIRVRTLDGRTIVEAAHIRTWSETYDDRPANGLSLCQTCHWTFDRGLLRVSSAYEIHASVQLRLDSNLPGYLVSLEGRSIVLPSENAYRPDADCLDWHYEHVFRRS